MLILFSLISSVWAFDPLSALGVINTVGSTIGGALDVGAEVAGSASAFSELYTELDEDAQMSTEANQMISDIQELEATAREAGYTSEEILAITGNAPDGVKNVSAAIKRITSGVRAAKRAAKLFTKLDSASKRAQIDTANYEAEHLRVAYQNLYLSQQAELKEAKKEYQNIADTRKATKAAQAAILKKGALPIGATGAFTFPTIKDRTKVALEIANKLRPWLMGLVLFAFFVRLSFYQFALKGIRKYGDLLQDTLVCFLLMAAYPLIAEATAAVTSSLANAIVMPGPVAAPAVASFKPEFPGSFTLSWQYILAITQWVCFEVVSFIGDVGLAVMIVFFPIIIFGSQMLNFAIGWPIFLALFFSISLWPLTWNAIGLLAFKAYDGPVAGQGINLYGPFITLLQLFTPFIGAKVLKGNSPLESASAVASTIGKQAIRAPARLVGAGVAMGKSLSSALDQIAEKRQDKYKSLQKGGPQNQGDDRRTRTSGDAVSEQGKLQQKPEGPLSQGTGAVMEPATPEMAEYLEQFYAQVVAESAGDKKV